MYCRLSSSRCEEMWWDTFSRVWYNYSKVAITKLCIFNTFVTNILIRLFVASGTKGGVHMPGPEFQSCSLQRTAWLSAHHYPKRIQYISRVEHSGISGVSWGTARGVSILSINRFFCFDNLRGRNIWFPCWESFHNFLATLRCVSASSLYNCPRNQSFPFACVMFLRRLEGTGENSGCHRRRHISCERKRFDIEKIVSQFCR